MEHTSKNSKEFLNPKSKALNPKQIQMTKIQNLKIIIVSVLNLKYLNFEIV